MKIRYEIEDHGAEHDQYFQGAGVENTEFDHIATGSADCARDAAVEALNQMCEQIDSVPDEVVDAIEKEIAELPSRSCHEDCQKEFDRDYTHEREWAVTRQHPWDGEPAKEYIEISTDHMSPGMVGKAIFCTQPEEVVAMALSEAEHANLPIFFGSAECGSSADDRESAQSLEEWADRMNERMVQDRESAFDVSHEDCEVYHYVSIRWTVEP